jgi:hypothetical protein
MGSLNHPHPCCEKNVNQPSPVATVQRSHVPQPVFTAAALDVASILPTVEFEFRHVKFDSPPHPPPSLNSPLRI